MKLQGLRAVLFVLILVLAGGCDSGVISKPSKSEPSAKSETESPSETSMESAQATTDPVALALPEDAVGAGDNNEGVSQYEQGHWDVAQQHFEKAIAANANLAEAHYNLALSLDKLGNHGEATNHFTTALELAPDNPSIKDSGILKAHVGG